MSLGLVPYSYFGAGSWNNQLRVIQFPATYATALFRGDHISKDAGGILKGDTNGANANCGVIQGFYYRDTSGVLHNTKYWPGVTDTFDGFAYAQVISDPMVLYSIQTSGGAGLIQANLGSNAKIVLGAGSTSSGLSGFTLDCGAGGRDVTDTFPLKIIDLTPDTGNEFGVVGNYALVLLNNHELRAGTLGYV